jgi:hypothetical protein
MPISQTIPTGKNNMLASLRAYMTANLPGAVPTGTYQILFEQYENAEGPYPVIAFEDLGVPQLGGHAFDDFIGDGLNDNGFPVQYYGKIAQTMVEFNCIAQMSDPNNPQDAALQQCYQMRDQIEQMVMFSGRNDHNGNQILPPIQLMNYDTNPASTTGSVIWAPMEKDSIWMEQYIGTDPEKPGIKRLAIRVRFYWHLLET